MSYNPYKKHVAKQRRIAVCLSGYSRNFSETVESFKKHVIRDQECDVFIHTWDLQDSYLRIANPQKFDVDKFTEAFNPQKIIVEQKPEFILSDTMLGAVKEPRDCGGMMSMFYSIFQANELKRKYEEENDIKYDVVIRTRPDVLYYDDLIVPLEMRLDRVYIPLFGDFGGLNDQIAYGSSEVINKYSELYNRVDELISHKAWMNPEVLMRTNLEVLRIGVNRFNLNYALMRTDKSLQNNFQRQYGRVR